MSIDERLQALAESVELMQGTQRDFEHSVRQALETLVSLHGDTQRDIQSTQRDIQRMERAIERLAHIAVAHEDRISDLERKRQ